MNVDLQKAKRLGFTTTCSVPLHVPTFDEPSVCTLPSTAHDHGLCVVLIKANDKLVARVTHVASGFAIGMEHGDYPATKVGVTAALHELKLLLPLTDWTRPVDELEHAKLDAEVIVRRCRAAFPGKLVGNVVHRDVAEPVPEIVKWRVYAQDDAGVWSFVDIAHEDHLIGAVDEALTRFDGPNSFTRRDTPVISPLDQIDVDTRRLAFDFDHVLHLFRGGEGWRSVIVEPDACSFDLCCTQLIEMHDVLAAEYAHERDIENPRHKLGIWKSGPKFGQLKLPAKLPPEQCVEILAQQERYDAQARKVSQLVDDMRELERHFASDEPIPERVTKLCPRETPNGHTDALALLGLMRETAKRLCSCERFLGKCISQLEKYLREYESVETYGFAPRSRCIMVADPNEPGDVDREVEIEDVHVSRGSRWSSAPTWNHERDVVEVYGRGDRWSVSVDRLKPLA
jgi:hypothetical protein